MLENIALSVSTFFFVVCSILLNGFSPAVPADKNSPSAPIEQVEQSPAVVYVASMPDHDHDHDGFELTGVWESFGHTYEFTAAGKLIIDGETMRYTRDGSTVTVGKTGGETLELAIEPTGDRSMRLNGVTMYKVN